MSTASLSIGTRIKHPIYGAGIILDNSMSSAYNIVFKHHGEKSIAKDFPDFEILELAPLPENRLALGDVQHIIEEVMRKWAGETEKVNLGKKWHGGKMFLQPADESLKPKEIPIEAFFHKIVMMRDRIRVLEQNINKNKSLSDEEKVHIQQYITRVYGSMTSFNVLFANKEDYFSSEGR